MSSALDPDVFGQLGVLFFFCSLAHLRSLRQLWLDYAFLDLPALPLCALRPWILSWNARVTVLQNHALAETHIPGKHVPLTQVHDTMGYKRRQVCLFFHVYIRIICYIPL